MTEESINIFLCLVECGNMTTASKIMYISQPTISRQMQLLEQELEVSLFARQKGGRNIELSDKGQEFLAYAKRIKKLFQASMKISQGRQYQYLNVSALASLNTFLLDNIYKQIICDFPNIKMNITNLHSLEAYTQIAHGLLDLSLITITKHQTGIETNRAFIEDIQIVCNRNSKYCGCTDLYQLPSERAIYVSWTPDTDGWYIHWFGRTANNLIAVENLSIIKTLLETTDCWAFVPASVFNRWAKNGDIISLNLASKMPKRIVHYLVGQDSNRELVSLFLDRMEKEIENQPNIHSLLSV